jgi:UDP:flavonoid glycosyltransferase YjiC (YdhE family)
MPEMGHFQALRAVAARLAARGLQVTLFTHADFRRQAEEDGLSFFDLFARYPLDEADDRSSPIPCRYVSFAGHYAAPIIEDLRVHAPALILYETFSVIAPVAARALGVPYVNVCVNHNPNPARVLAALEHDARVSVSQQCTQAVKALRERFGLADASPFSYVSCLSPLLNIYSEPPQFLDEEDRKAFEPVAFFGCLRDSAAAFGPAATIGRCPYFGDKSPNDLRVYVSFGTVIWKYYAAEAVNVLRAISRACAGVDHVRVVISLGGAEMAPGVADELRRANVSVLPFVDQWKILSSADLFVTHHGLNSTHESIFHRVPMASYPYFADQPALARTCQNLGIAIPLAAALRVVPSVGDVKTALASFLANRNMLRANLERACGWERETMEGRDRVIHRIVSLIGH